MLVDTQCEASSQQRANSTTDTVTHTVVHVEIDWLPRCVASQYTLGYIASPLSRSLRAPPQTRMRQWMENVAHTLWESSQWASKQLVSVPPASLDLSAFNSAMELASSELYGAGLHAFIFDANGKQILSRSYGSKYCRTVRWCEGFGDEQFTKDTLIPVFSISKIISVMGSLDEPLSQSLPDFFSNDPAAGFQGILSNDAVAGRRCFINYENHYRYNASGTPSIDITLEKCVQEKPILIYKNL